MLSNRVKCWSMSSAKYVKDTIHNIEDLYQEESQWHKAQEEGISFLAQKLYG